MTTKITVLVLLVGLLAFCFTGCGRGCGWHHGRHCYYSAPVYVEPGCFLRADYCRTSRVVFRDTVRRELGHFNGRR